ncbi:hypothetical protein N657DRAFT_585182 [Parathielavia appendiculata]|uniref:HMG box domain-containing protein n=1 Tax=Parathielavia appendiculata TaxID=2587402 RepID=A0AAN6Z8L6_9PEZI|nr:hypothetical protein N657DRAFT_585182 [Parathielavia appendiculata]
MDRHTPTSPGPTRVEPLPSGFNELLQHNASTLHPRDTIATEATQTHSQPGSRYGTPGPQPHQPQGPPQPYSTPATSPPTPSRGSDMMTTRSSNARGEIGARVLGAQSTRITKSTPKRKKERAKPPKNMPVLDKPMSELTKNSSIPIADIETYVNRSCEVRRQEIETGKNPGRVKRPMNAFMLYRKAYQQRAKEWASQHNHQIVSRVCGLSWPLEPEHIRQQFKAWADLERDNHQKAHPNYKFTPSKPHKPPPKFEAGYDDRSDGSDLEDYDWSGRAGSRIRSTTHTPGADSDCGPSRSVYAAVHAQQQQHQLTGMHPMGMLRNNARSAALDVNSAKTMAAAYDRRDHLMGQYYEAHFRNQQQRHLHHGAVVEDFVRRTPSPSLAFQQHNAGLHSHYELPNVTQYALKAEPPTQHQQTLHSQPSQQHHHQQQHHAQQFEHRIDPSLMPQEDVLFDAGTNFNNAMAGMYDGGLGGTTQHGWQTGTGQHLANPEAESQFSHAFGMGLDETLSLEQHTQFLRGADEWQIEPLPETAHFDTSWVEPKAE